MGKPQANSYSANFQMRNPLIVKEIKNIKDMIKGIHKLNKEHEKFQYNNRTVSGAKVIGQIIPYAGRFGIGKNPESFSVFGTRKNFVDKS